MSYFSLTHTVLWLVVVAWSGVTLAYPSVERRPTGLSSPPLDLGLQTPTALRVDDDNDLLYVTYGQTFRIVDLATFALSSTTPYDISSDTNLSGAIEGVAIDENTNTIYATQEGGYLLSYQRNALATAPTRVEVAAGKTLTLVEYDATAQQLYLLNETDRTILRYDPSTQTAVAISFSAASGTSFTINAMQFVPNVSGSTGALYCTTANGRVLVLSASDTTIGQILLDTAGTDNLKGLSASADGTQLFVVNATDKVIHVISTATNAQTSAISLAANSDLDQLIVSDVTIPTATYGFAMGSSGLSLFDIAAGDVFDLGSTDTEDEPLSVSGTGPLAMTDDGYLFIAYGKLAVITDNPFVTITGVTYASGTSLGAGNSVTLAFQSDEAGTYDVRVGGSASSLGSAPVDGAGAAITGSLAADTSQSVTIPYDANSSLWSEGSNRVFVFMTDAAANIGRMATSVTVDTPPPTVTITGTGFGNERLYINVRRLAVADIASYRAYVDTDPTLVATKADIAGSAGQPDAGTDPVITVAGLANGTTYYLAVEAVDTNGNISATRTTTIESGAVASSAPEATYGPAGVSGERGCSLIPRE